MSKVVDDNVLEKEQALFQQQPARKNIFQQAQQLLEQQQPDAAIELLRTLPEPAQNPECCALLARCYFQRGDVRGDVHASTYFAKQAMDLNHVNSEMIAILAIGQFRKQNYAEAAESFARYVTADFPCETHYLYGLALHYSGDLTAAKKWLTLAAAAKPDHPDYQTALSALEQQQQQPLATINFKKPGLGGMQDVRPRGEPTPYRSNALSRLAGFGTAAKDLVWLDKNIPCQKKCPAGTDIPAYLSEILKGNFGAAYEINLRDNVFPGVLGRVCSRPCESDCRHGWDKLGESVAICFSKRAAADNRVNDQPVVLTPLFPPTGKRIAIIGTGPAGLAAARNLALFGHKVTVFEKQAEPGGMMIQGIPEFRLPREVIAQEIRQIELLGVTIRCGMDIGKDIPLGDLLKSNDAVILAAGTLRPNWIDIPGQQLAGIVHGLDFLLEANQGHPTQIGEKVVIIGGGFTAMDCARTAKRLGAHLIQMVEPQLARSWEDIPLTESKADVQVLYRRSPDEMLITPGELEELGHENIPMKFLASPIEYIGHHGKVTAVRFIQNQLSDPDASGRRRPVAIAGSEFTVPADLVLLATGQFPDVHWLEPELKQALVQENQWFKASPGYETEIKSLFLAGDFSTGATTLIEAIAHAKECALRVDHFLMGVARTQEVAIIEDAPRGSQRIREMDAVPLQPMPTISLAGRSFRVEVETGYPPDAGVDEAQRCYQCHYKFEIDPDKCIFCNWCLKAKPQKDCIVEISALNYGENNEIIGFERAANSEAVTQVYINQEECIRCNACVDACPVDCISVQKVSKARVRCSDLDHNTIERAPRI